MTTVTVQSASPPQAAPDEGDENLGERNEVALPKFEGQKVDFTNAKLVGASTFEIDDHSWPLDTCVQLRVVTQVSGVHHEVDPKSGKLVRVHRMRVMSVDVVGVTDAEVMRGL